MFTDVQPLRVEVGRTWLWPDEVPELTVGSTVQLDTCGDQDVQICLAGCLIARGHAVVIGGKLGVEVSELVPADIPEGKSH
ncbi:MAG: FliM/FliN family flagellar motor switch protein [Phycisphaerae bacterium]|nr:FliM/FliN family flagellar motor switch protein [Planctomycetota bacterium]MBL7220861.1 FliM/FliN family flagellar motor switch protein [Phycisphaerae bacterium]